MALCSDDILLELIPLSPKFVIMAIEYLHQPYISPVIECVLFCPSTLMQESDMSTDEVDAPSFNDYDW